VLPAIGVKPEAMNERANVSESDAQARNIADAVARRSYGKLVAFLAVRTRDVAAAEDALSEAFVSALVDWPRNGCPSNPVAWLLTAARLTSGTGGTGPSGAHATR
jgi:DNA-directed RNA polymerase specialized sigma24 family protein